MKRVIMTFFAVTLVALPAVAKERVPVLSGKGESTVEVPMLVRDVSRGAIIQPSDIVWVEMPDRKVRRGTVLEESGIVGMVAKRQMKRDEQIASAYLERPRIIERGGLVSMIYRTSNMSLRTIAVALEDGSAGDVIRIRNEDSGKVVLARVAESGEVIVNYDGAL